VGGWRGRSKHKVRGWYKSYDCSFHVWVSYRVENACDSAHPEINTSLEVTASSFTKGLNGFYITRGGKIARKVHGIGKPCFGKVIPDCLDILIFVHLYSIKAGMT
jgi:hypothetical protein